MRHLYTRFVAFGANVSGALLLCGCNPAIGDGGISSAPSPLQVETVPPAEGVRFVHRRFLDRPDLVMASYAAGMTTETQCSGALIGPNTFITAAHCGDVGRSTSGLTFTQTDGLLPPDGSNRLVVRRSTWSNCLPLAQTFDDLKGSDLVVIYCPPNGDGLGPGDIFGYLDLDGSSEVSISEQVYALFSSTSSPSGAFLPLIGGEANGGQIAQSPASPGLTAPIVPARTLQYGLGPIFSLSCLNNGTGDSGTLGIEGVVGINMPAEGGNSGGLYVSPSTYRVRVGPQSVGGGGWGVFNCDSPDGPINQGANPTPRFAKSIYDYIWYSRFRSGLTPDHVNSSNIASIVDRNNVSMGLSASTYASGPGYFIDDNLDSIIDIQHDIELGLGESPTPWKWLGFESQRRNSLWTLAGSASLSAFSSSSMSISYGTSSYLRLAEHAHLNLSPGSTYRIQITANSSSQGGSNPLSVGLCALVSGSCSYVANRYLPTSSGGGSRVFTSRGTIPGNATATTFVIDAQTSFSGTLSAVSIVEEGAVMDFDSHDTRINWRNDVTGERAVIVPAGRLAGGSPTTSIRLRVEVRHPRSAVQGRLHGHAALRRGRGSGVITSTRCSKGSV